MGLLDTMKGALAAGSAEGSGGDAKARLVQAVVGLLTDERGGLAALVARLRQGGLGDAVESWISDGPNLPVSPAKLQDALGDDLVGQLAEQSGQGVGDIAAMLAPLLPEIIHRLTPGGELPAGGAGGIGQIGSLLGGLGGLGGIGGLLGPR